MRTSEPRPLVSVRTMLIVLLELLAGAVTGGWPAAAVLLAGSATAGRGLLLQLDSRLRPN